MNNKIYISEQGEKLKPLTDAEKLTIIKLTHTIIWGIFVVAILYVCYAGVFNQVNKLVWFCIAAVLLEGIVLLINKRKCPLTSLACKYADVHPVGFDIFLPKWLAKHNKLLFSTIFLIGLSLVLWRTVSIIPKILFYPAISIPLCLTGV